MAWATASPPAGDPSAARAGRARPSLRTVLLAANLAVLALPVAGVLGLRLYETELVRRTESELVVQAALLASQYRRELLAELHQESAGERYGRPVPPSSTVDGLEPAEARIDLARDRPLPPAPDPVAAGPADPAAVAVGARLSEQLREIQRTTLAGYRIVDPDGTVVASSRDELGLSIGNRAEVARALAGERVSLIRQRISPSPVPALDSVSRSSRIRVFVATPVREADRVLGAVVVSRTPLSLSKALYARRDLLLAMTAVLLASVLLVSVLTSRMVTAPVRALVRQTEAVARGERSGVAPLESPGTREIASLSASVVAMSATLAAREDYIRAFAAAVSHEFKSPLASIRATAELLSDGEGSMTEAERARFVANIDADAERLGRLVGRLLELARADVLRPGHERADVARALGACAGRFEGELDVVVRVAPGVGSVRMGSDLLESILGTLLENARQHAGRGTRVEVVAAVVGGLVDVTVSDEGAGISAGNAPRVFDPFFTTARDSGGTGLGLTVVRAMLVAHGGTIALVPAARGASFRLTIPA